MLEKIFLQILNMSFTASFVILFVLVARLLLKKAPKIFSYTLWGVVLFRLICPFRFESMFSLIPFKGQPIPQTAALGENVVLELSQYTSGNQPTDTQSSPRHITRKYGGYSAVIFGFWALLFY